MRDRGYSVKILDHRSGNSCSNVAAGLMNPITGKRQTLSWRSEDFFPKAIDFYRRYAPENGQNAFRELPIHRILSSVAEQNRWSTADHPDRFKLFIEDQALSSLPSDRYHNALGTLVVKSGGKLDMKAFLKHAHQLLLNDLAYEEVDQAIDITPNSMYAYQNDQADHLIHAEGWNHADLWNFLPFTPMKGEILTLQSDHLDTDKIVIGSCFIAPETDQTFRVGATYDWRSINTTKTGEAREALIQRFQKMTDVPFEVIDHQVGIRPAVSDRRPLIGKHPNHNNLFLFNGMGSKGASMTPLLAEWFIDFMEGQALPDEVNLNRFIS